MNEAIYIETSKCKGEMTCMRACPTGAIRVKNSKAKILDDKCIDCGECIKVCKSKAILPLTSTYQDLSQFEYTVAIPSLALYSQFEKNVKPKNILSALKKIGFDEVVDVTGSYVKIYYAVLNYFNISGLNKPLINTYCPACISLIRTKYPELLSRIIPVINPLELCARETKEMLSKKLNIAQKNLGVIYITACPAKISDIGSSFDKKSYFDGAVSISDVYKMLFNELLKNERAHESTEHFNIDGFGLNFAKPDGISNIINKSSFVVTGGKNVLEVLEDIENDRLRDIDLVAMQFCYEGCISGPLTVENMYKASNKINLLIREMGESKHPLRKQPEIINGNYYVKNSELYEDNSVNYKDLRSEILKINERNEYLSKLPGINCGACGAPTCLDLANDITENEAKIDECIFKHNDYLKLKLKEKLKLLNNLHKE